MMRPRVALTPDQTIYDALLFHIKYDKAYLSRAY